MLKIKTIKDSSISLMKFQIPSHSASSGNKEKYFPEKHVKKLVSKNLSSNLKRYDKASHSHLFINQTKKERH
jgi:hypothetical protein